MNLTTKTFLIITSAVIFGLFSIFGVAGYVLVEDFKDIERNEVGLEMQRVQGFVDDDLLAMEGDVRGLSDLVTVLFGSGFENQTAEQLNRTTQVLFSTFLINEIDVVFAFTDGPNGTEAFGFGFDPFAFNFTEPPVALNATLQDAAWIGSLQGTDAKSGLMRAGDVTYLVAAVPFVLDFGTPEFNTASLAIVRAVDEAYAEHLSDTAQVPVGILAPDDPKVQSRALGQDLALERHSWSRMSVYSAVDDVEGAPAMILQVDLPRTTFKGGLDSITFFFYASLGIAALFLGAGLFTMQTLVTGRVHNLSRRMQEIRADEALDQRVTERGNDEVALLAHDFNRLMESLEQHDLELQEINEDLESFARIVSHDLQSPLSTFTLNLSLARKKAEANGDTEAINRIQRMERGVRTMSERIQGVLEYSRSRTLDLKPEPVALDGVVKQVMSDLEGEVLRTGARVRCLPLPTVQGDPTLLAQVFQNLISNAIKYGNDGEPPQVRVWAQKGPGTFQIHVEDRGRGFTDDEVAQMLRPFTRLKGSVGRSGHGIGLATVVRILERLGGSLTAHGQPAVGARFTVVLPQA